MNDAALIFVDWGSTRLRAFLIGRDGRCLDQRKSDQGVLAMAGRDFAETLDTMIAEWAAAPVLLAGMVGSRNGWVETPYVDCPAGIAELAAALVKVRADTFLIPGLKTSGPDLMRGEEVQILGVCSPDSAATVLLPGTHCKWAQWRSDGKITAFRTALTGELFQLLSNDGSIGSLIDASGAWSEHDFIIGLGRAKTAGGLLHHLFGVRAAIVTGGMTPAAARSQLSGLLIGHEIAGLLPAEGVGRGVTVVGAEAIRAPYALALARAGVTSTHIDGDAAGIAGAIAIARVAGLCRFEEERMSAGVH